MLTLCLKKARYLMSSMKMTSADTKERRSRTRTELNVATLLTANNGAML
jgi:hypothetical protein